MHRANTDSRTAQGERRSRPSLAQTCAYSFRFAQTAHCAVWRMRNSSRRANGTFEKSVVSLHFRRKLAKKSTIYGGKIIYIICNLKKFHKNDVADIEKGNERDETYVGDNKNIDHEKTNLNYHVVKPETSYWDKINKELAAFQTNRKIRKDAVYICSCVLKASSEFFEGKTLSEQRQFFTDYAKFFADKYGEQNIVSAVVHMDETTLHMHLNFIPITESRLCAKELCNRKLAQSQTEVWKASNGQAYSQKEKGR